MECTGKEEIEINRLNVIRVYCDKGHAQRPIDNKKHLRYPFWMEQLVELLLDHKQDMVLFVCGWDGEFGILCSASVV